MHFTQVVSNNMASSSETPKGRGRPKKTKNITGVAKRKLEFTSADTDMSVNSASQNISVAQSDLQLPITDINSMTENIPVPLKNSLSSRENVCFFNSVVQVKIHSKLFSGK